MLRQIYMNEEKWLQSIGCTFQELKTYTIVRNEQNNIADFNYILLNEELEIDELYKICIANNISNIKIKKSNHFSNDFLMSIESSKFHAQSADVQLTKAFCKKN